MSLAAPPIVPTYTGTTTGPEYQAVPMSRDEFDRMVGESRSEWADGMAYLVMAPAAYPHNRAAARLGFKLQAELPDLDVVFDGGVRMENSDRVPDIVVLKYDGFDGAWLPYPPIIVVEVLSRSTWRTDLGPKAAEYAASGVAHYWTMDRDTPTIIARSKTGNPNDSDNGWRIDAIIDADNPVADVPIEPYGTVHIDLAELFR